MLHPTNKTSLPPPTKTPCASGVLRAPGRATRHPLGLADFVRGREEGHVDAARHGWLVRVEVVAVAAKLSTLDHPGLERRRQLRLGVVTQRDFMNH